MKLSEQSLFERTGAVDREAGVVPGVKLLGLTSRNGRRYSESAVRKAAGLYEGTSVYLNHCKPGQTRDVRDLAGNIRNVQFLEGRGLFGDVHYLKGDPSGEKLALLAEGNLRNVGMSHDADGTVKRRGSENVVEEITEVNSVDVVHNPATTRSFKEQAMTTTLGKLIESAGYSHSPAKLLEMMPELAASPDEAVEAPEVAEGESGPDPIEAVAAALAAKVADAIKDPAVSDAEVGQMAKAASKTVASVRADMEPKAEEPTPPADGEESADEESTTEAVITKAIAKATAPLLESLGAVTKELDARRVLESRGAAVTPQLLEELVACKDRKAMETLVENWTPAKLGKPRPVVGRANSSEPIPESADSYLSTLKARGLR